jgi:hypothetical protein
MAKVEGTAAVVAAAVEAAEPEWFEPEDVPLPLGLVDSDGRAQRSAPGQVVAKRGAGRPPGARNKRTEAFREYLLSRYRSPLTVLAEIYTRPVADLARELACPVKDALKMQMDAARELAPYLHSKAPIEVTGKDGQAVSLVVLLGLAGGESRPGDAAKPILEGRLMAPEEIERNQDDSE